MCWQKSQVFYLSNRPNMPAVTVCDDLLSAHLSTVTCFHVTHTHRRRLFVTFFFSSLNLRCFPTVKNSPSQLGNAQCPGCNFRPLHMFPARSICCLCAETSMRENEDAKPETPVIFVHSSWIWYIRAGMEMKPASGFSLWLFLQWFHYSFKDPKRLHFWFIGKTWLNSLMTGFSHIHLSFVVPLCVLCVNASLLLMFTSDCFSYTLCPTALQTCLFWVNCTHLKGFVWVLAPVQVEICSVEEQPDDMHRWQMMK